MYLNAKTGAFSLALIAASINLANAQALEEVVVTAEKRTADLQDTAISVAVITGEDAIKKGSISMDDMLKDMIGVNMQPIGFGSAVNIRGMGWDMPVDISEGAVSVNFDGATNSNTQTSIFGFFDMERLEVLRGPQGTLYGRNATAGAVNVNSANPNVEGVSGYGVVELGNYSHTRLEGAINLPINDSNAVRLAVSDVDRDGYMSTGAADAVGTAVRGKYLFEPSDDFRAVLSAQRSEIGGISPDNNVDYANWAAGNYFLSTATSPEQEYEFVSETISANVDFTAGPGIVTFIPSYDKAERGGTSVVPFGPDAGTLTPAGENLTKQKSAELRYASLPESDIQWTTGLYYYESDRSRTGGGPCASGCLHGKTTEAVFGQLTIPLTDLVRLSLGGRYANDESTYQQPGNPSSAFYDASLESSKFTWKAGLEMDVTDEAMAYASIATSTRPGGFNEVNPEMPTFDQENVTSYEVGLKSRWLDQTLQVNGSAFYYDYEDYQSVDIRINEDNEFEGNFYNAGSARNYGLELETITLVGESTRITLGANYLNAKFNSDVIIHPDIFGPGVNLNGETLPRSPQWTVKGGLENMFDIGDVGMLTTNISARWSDDQIGVANRNDSSEIDAYAIVDLNANFEPYEGIWSLNLWVKNAADKLYKAGASDNRVQVGPPRMYGGSVTFNF